MRLLSIEITIEAPAEVVYSLLTEEAGLLKWMAVQAKVDARPGGELEWTHENGATMCGRFVELIPPRRLVFTYGWKGADMGVPPESTTVEIELEETHGTTSLRLVHRGLPPAAVNDHEGGWRHFFEHLRRAVSA